MSKLPVSIIVPCYNCEPYIERNINSIINQTYNNFEIIYINDGSTDQTLKILKSYQKKDSRIKIFSITNQGVSNARNIGIKNARGKYIAFIDADDYIDCNYIMKLYQETNNEKIDYVKCCFKRSEDTNFNISQESFYCEKKENFHKLYEKLLNTYQLHAVCAALIRKEIIDKNNIHFDKNYSYAEDLNFNIDLFSKINNFKFINYVGYYYYDNPSSLTRKIQSNKIIKNIEAVIKVYSRFYDFEKNQQKVNYRIEKELNHILDSLFYFNSKSSLKERIQIYKTANKLLKDFKIINKTLNMKLLHNKLYILYDFKNYFFKKIPRKIKRFLLK